MALQADAILCALQASWTAPTQRAQGASNAPHTSVPWCTDVQSFQFPRGL